MADAALAILESDPGFHSPLTVRLMEGLRVGCLISCDRNSALDRKRLAKRLDSLNLVHCFRGVVRLAATRAGPQRYTFDNQEVGALAEAACHMLELD